MIKQIKPLQLEPGMLITNSNGDFTINDDGMDINGVGVSGKLGIGPTDSVRFGKYGDGYGGQVGAYNEGGTISTKNDAFLYLRGGNGIHLDPQLGRVKVENLPTSEPSNSDEVWNDNGTLKIS